MFVVDCVLAISSKSNGKLCQFIVALQQVLKYLKLMQPLVEKLAVRPVDCLQWLLKSEGV